MLGIAKDFTFIISFITTPNISYMETKQIKNDPIFHLVTKALIWDSGKVSLIQQHMCYTLGIAGESENQCSIVEC